MKKILKILVITMIISLFYLMNISLAESVTLSSVSVTTPPKTVEYEEGEQFDPIGMVVTATYSDG